MSSNARIGAVVGVLVVLGAVGWQARERLESRSNARAEGGMAPLYSDLGSYHRAVATTEPLAQQYFDQGLRLTYAFNHSEAIRAFETATRLDPECAMCYWGIAYAYGPNINAPMDDAAGAAAYAAAEAARARLAHASPVERALIEALATRYSGDAAQDRGTLDRAYAAAMADVRARHPDDADVLTLHAEAVMNLSPWNYWTETGAPRAGTAELIADLERVLATDPSHPGACHYYIHAVEAQQPQRAVACAERLAALMPGAGHLVHMPAHIYIRVGRWADAITSNEHAVHADETYIADQRPTGVYPIAYYPHNYHFLSFAATMAGRSRLATDAARSVVASVPVDVARAVPPVEPLLAYLHLTHVTFGQWDAVLGEAVPPADLRYATALVQYARGVAWAAQGDAAQAAAALTAVRAGLAAAEDELERAVLDIAQHALAGEIAFRGGDLREAEGHFRAAAAIEDGLLYMEPPHWYYPVRHSLGAVLLTAGRPADAERVYREDLVRFPENAWSLSGLQASLAAQGRQGDATALDARLAALRSDVRLTASRF
jgi:tetratricopeptide (TPR) repeat protein